MSGFQFPPPPPPPPKPSSGSGDAYHSQRGGHEPGRGRGRGRGSHNGRGRPDRGSHAQHYNRQNYSQGYVKGAATAAYGSTTFGSSGSSTLSPSASSGFANTGLLPGSYVNPAFFTNSVPLESHHQHPARPLHNVHSQQSPTAGHKRKLEQLRGPTQDKRKPAPSTAPSVPSFGASLVPNTQDHNVAGSRNSPSSDTPWKRSSNILGLTPQSGDPQYSSSESEGEGDVVDEEAMYAELGTALTFEHNGTVMSLNTAADLSAWKDERRKNWPTRHRMAEKADERRKVGDQRRRLMADAISKLAPSQQHLQAEASLRRKAPHSTAQQSIVHNGTTEPELTGATETLIAQHLTSEQSSDHGDGHVTKSPADDKSWHNVQEQSSLRRMSLGQRSVRFEDKGTNSSRPEQPANSTATGGPDSKAENASKLGLYPDEPSEQNSESSCAESDVDEPPEEEDSKPSPVVENEKASVCRYFAASGRCRDGESCRFKHENSHSMGQTLSVPVPRQEKQNPHPRSGSGQAQAKPSLISKNSIYKLLMEKEQDNTDLLALQVIRHLGDSGFFTIPEQANGAFHNSKR